MISVDSQRKRLKKSCETWLLQYKKMDGHKLRIYNRYFSKKLNSILGSSWLNTSFQSEVSWGLSDAGGTSG